MRSVPGELMSRTRFRTVSRVFYFERFFFGRLFRLVLAKSLSCFSLIDSAICLEAPLSDDFDFSPRFAASAAPAAICCFLDFAGIRSSSFARTEARAFYQCVVPCTGILLLVPLVNATQNEIVAALRGDYASGMNKLFRHFAEKVSFLAGTSWAFICALAALLSTRITKGSPVGLHVCF